MEGKPGRIICLIGPAGAGKDTLTAPLVASTSFKKYASHTTRQMREGESQGHPYIFCSPEEYKGIITTTDLFNDIEVGGDRYFMTLEPFALAEAGADLVFHMEYAEAMKVWKRYPNTYLVLVMPPSEPEQRRRLLNRGMSPEKIEQRLADQKIQLPPQDPTRYDLVIVNDDLETATKQLLEFAGSI